MFDNIRKHQRWLWFFIGALVTFSFVYYFLPNTPGLNPTPRAELGSLDGDPITLREYQRARARVKVELAVRMLGQWGPRFRTDMLDSMVSHQQVYERLLQEHWIRQHGIAPSEAAMVQAANEVLKQFAAHGVQQYDQLIQVLGRAQIPNASAEFNDFIRHDVSMDMLAQLAGVHGSILSPASLEAEYRRDNTEVKIHLAAFLASQHLDQVTVTEAELSEYFETQKASYMTPPQVQIAYVAFPASNYLSQADEQMAKEPNFEKDLEREYQARAGELKNEEGAPLTPEEGKARLKEDLRKRLALLHARKASLPFATEILELEEMKMEEFAPRAEKHGLKVETSEPFSREKSPEGLDDAVVDQAFALSEQEPFAGPVVGEEAVFVIGLKQRIEPMPQPLDAVREKVTEQFKNDAARKRAQSAGAAFAEKVKQGMAEGKTFEAIAEAEKVALATPPPFTPSSRKIPELPEGLPDFSVINAVREIEPGGATGFVSTPTGGFVAAVTAKTPVGEEQFQTGFPAYFANRALMAKRQAFQSWYQFQVNQWLRGQSQAVQQQFSERNPQMGM